MARTRKPTAESEPTAQPRERVRTFDDYETSAGEPVDIDDLPLDLAIKRIFRR